MDTWKGIRGNGSKGTHGISVLLALAALAVLPACAATGDTEELATTQQVADPAPEAGAQNVASVGQPSTRPMAVPGAGASVPPATSAPDPDVVLKLGPGDAVNVQVYGRPELSTTTYITEKGVLPMPLAGPVPVLGLSPAQASQRVAAALRDGQLMVDPQVTITLNQFRSQQVSVLGEVHTPGRYPIESRTTVFDLLAQAGGTTADGASLVYLMRPDGRGGVGRAAIDLKTLSAVGDTAPEPMPVLKGGDSLYVPRADQFYIYGEVQQPNMYRLEPGMMVIQAISRGGGITARGSARRIQIERRNADGQVVTLNASPSDPVEPNDVIRVKERLF